jgi:hypothetical protein
VSDEERAKTDTATAAASTERIEELLVDCVRLWLRPWLPPDVSGAQIGAAAREADVEEIDMRRGVGVFSTVGVTIFDRAAKATTPRRSASREEDFIVDVVHWKQPEMSRFWTDTDVESAGSIQVRSHTIFCNITCERIIAS